MIESVLEQVEPTQLLPSDTVKTINSLLESIMYLGKPIMLVLDTKTMYTNEDIKIEYYKGTVYSSYNLYFGTLLIYKFINYYSSNDYHKNGGFLSHQIDTSTIPHIINYLEIIAQEADTIKFEDAKALRELQRLEIERNTEIVMKICGKAPHIDHIIDIV